MAAARKMAHDTTGNSAAVIVFGRHGQKARGSWFAPDMASAAKSAAELMGMNSLTVANDDLRQLATKLPEGRMFESGKAFVPFVKGTLVDALATHLPRGEQLKIRLVGSASEPAKTGVTNRPKGRQSKNSRTFPKIGPTSKWAAWFWPAKATMMAGGPASSRKHIPKSYGSSGRPLRGIRRSRGLMNKWPCSGHPPPQPQPHSAKGPVI